MITVFAPAGIGEVTQATDLAATIVEAITADPDGPLQDGDVLVVTSKIISKHEGMEHPEGAKPELRRRETVRTVARRLGFAIVATRHGLVQAAAGIDASNVTPGTILALPVDPDLSARRLRAAITERTGARIGIVVSDTAGRAWRLGQTDHAIGAAGLMVMVDHNGDTDPYGNPLRVTLTAVADELAAAADLVKGKLTGRPVAVVRGLSHLVAAADEPGGTARDLVRPLADDLFRLGSRESVLLAVLETCGADHRYEELVELDDPAAVVDALGLEGDRARWVEALLRSAGRWSS
ncbi:coenzyme F420-0:L-glutamate ligase [Propionibacteriaceae bacterium Y2011]